MARRNQTAASDTVAPIVFEAALPQGTAFTLDGEGEATLKLVVPEQFAKVLSDNIHRLRNCSFIVRIDGLTP